MEKLSKVIAIIMVAIVVIGKANAQKGKGYEPVFEIAKRPCPQPTKLSMADKYVGKIVFSDQRLQLSNTAENLFKSSFGLGEPIYSRVFTSNAVKNYMLYNQKIGQTKQGAVENLQSDYIVYYYIDGKEVLKKMDNNNSSDLSVTNTWQRIVWEKDAYGGRDWHRDLYTNLGAGVHKVRVEIWGGKGRDLSTIKPIAEGEFDLVVKEGEKLKIGKSWKDYKNGDLAKDQKVKSKLTELYTEYLKEKYPEYTLKEIKILGDGYSINKDEYGLPKYRSARVAAYMIDNKSKKCYNFSWGYYQNYAGGGTYSDQFYSYQGWPDQTELDCE